MLDELFVKRAFNAKKAKVFGFKEAEGKYVYEAEIMNGEFRLYVLIRPDGAVDTRLIETETGDEYTLYKTEAVGAFVGSVRESVAASLDRIAERCFDAHTFKASQMNEIIEYASKKYGDIPEFLWETTPENAVLRRKDTKKWYAALLTVSKRKLLIDSDEKAEIINLRVPPERLTGLLEKDGFFPAWHMNKKHWCSIILDGGVETELILKFIDESYKLAL